MTEKARINSIGQTEIVDDTTGKILAVSRPKGKLKKAIEEGKPVKRRPPSLNKQIAEHWPYNAALCDEMLSRISEGETLIKICAAKGMPPRHVFYRWIRQVAGRKAEYDEARRSAAHHFADKVIETAESTKGYTNKEDKVKIDAYKWAAEKHDPETYSPRQQINSKSEHVTTLIIQTGVPEPDPIEDLRDAAIEVESSVVGGDS